MIAFIVFVSCSYLYPMPAEIIEEKIMLEVIKKDQEAIKEFIQQHGKDVQTKSGNTLLHFAAMTYNSSDLIKFLIKQGLRVGTRNNTGETPLWLAVYSRNYDNAKTLIEHGASITYQHKSEHNKFAPKGSTIMHQLISQFKDANREQISPLMTFITEQKQAPKLLTLGPIIPGTNTVLTPLMYAHEKNIPGLIEIIESPEELLIELAEDLINLNHAYV